MLERVWRKDNPPGLLVGGNVTSCSHYGKWYVKFLKKLKMELPYDPVIPFLGIYPDKTIIPKKYNTSTLMFRAALFTIA